MVALQKAEFAKLIKETEIPLLSFIFLWKWTYTHQILFAERMWAYMYQHIHCKHDYGILTALGTELLNETLWLYAMGIFQHSQGCIWDVPTSPVQYTKKNRLIFL